MDDQQRRDAGMQTRKAVLGEAHVKRAEAGRTPFNADFHDLITRYAWGDIWQREGLDRRTRSFITLAMLLALGRDDEFVLHLRGALNNGLSREEIRELLMHAAVYCGVPAANHGFKLAQETFRAVDAEF
ncbi:MAG: 4-carboxymuconolactone decarboxylase [Gammaproteobacteria bacterium]